MGKRKRRREKKRGWIRCSGLPFVLQRSLKHSRGEIAASSIHVAAVQERRQSRARRLNYHLRPQLFFFLRSTFFCYSYGLLTIQKRSEKKKEKMRRRHRLARLPPPPISHHHPWRYSPSLSLSIYIDTDGDACRNIKKKSNKCMKTKKRQK